MQRDPEAVAADLATQAEWCARGGSRSPLYAHILTWAAEDVRRGGMTWAILEPHRDEPLSAALGLRLMAGVHRLVLSGRAPRLEPHYPSVGGEADLAGVWDDFVATLEEAASELAQLVRRPLQTNEVGRCAALLGGFLVVARETGLPLRALEVGASAGLNLRWDHYLYEARGHKWGDPSSPVRLCGFDTPPAPPLDVRAEVIDRRGCDPNPVDPSSEDGRLTLLSCVWPDQPARLRLLRSALDVAARVPAEVDRAGALQWVPAQLEERRAGAATIVFHSIVMQYLSKPDRERFARLLEEAGEEATRDAPLAWLRMEPAGAEAEVRLTTWPGGRERLLARAGYHGSPVRWLEPN